MRCQLLYALAERRPDLALPLEDTKIRAAGPLLLPRTGSHAAKIGVSLARVPQPHSSRFQNTKGVLRPRSATNPRSKNPDLGGPIGCMPAMLAHDQRNAKS